MNGTPTLDDRHDLDDFERDIVHALRVKADQLVIDDGPFDAEARPVATLRPSSPATHRRRPLIPLGHPRSIRTDRRRPVAVAAALLALTGTVAVAQRLGVDGGSDRPDTVTAAAPLYTAQETGPAAFLPATVPEGWTLRQVNAIQTSLVSPAPTTWQLFGTDGPSPPARGVLVSSATNAESMSGRVIDGDVHRLGENPIIAPAEEPLAPAGTLEATWLDGDVLHRALAAGLSEAELRAFVEALAPYDDPTTGFEIPARSGLTLLETGSVHEHHASSAVYVGPGGPDDTIRVDAQGPDPYGGLLHRLVGEPGPGGPVIQGTMTEDGRGPFVSQLRADGWTLGVVSAGPTTAGDPAVLRAFLDAFTPFTRDELVRLGTAESVSATGTAGPWSFELHGADEDAAVALCLTPETGGAACTTAESWAPALPPVVTASAVVDGTWVIVVLSDGPVPRTVSAVPEGHQGPPYPEENHLDGERGQADDGRVVEVFTVPAEVGTVAVTVELTPEGGGTGVRYDRPPG